MPGPPAFMAPEALFPDLPAPLRVRGAGDSDAAFLFALYRSTRADLHALAADSTFIEQLVAWQWRAQQSGHRASQPAAVDHVIELDGRAIGRALLHVGEAAVELVDIALLPEARGAGYGTKLLSALQRSARTRGKAVRLTVNPANAAARRVYARLGFRAETADSTCERLVWSPNGLPDA